MMVEFRDPQKRSQDHFRRLRRCPHWEFYSKVPALGSSAVLACSVQSTLLWANSMLQQCMILEWGATSFPPSFCPCQTSSKGSGKGEKWHLGAERQSWEEGGAHRATSETHHICIGAGGKAILSLRHPQLFLPESGWQTSVPSQTLHILRKAGYCLSPLFSFFPCLHLHFCLFLLSQMRLYFPFSQCTAS